MGIRITFERVEFDPATGELRKDGRLARLEPQPAAVLALLASRPGALVTRDEIRRHIWGDATHVNVAENLAYCVRAIRLALDDDARAPRFVETIPRRGYRFLTPVGVAGLAASPPPAPIAPPTRWPRPARLAAGLAITIMLGSALWAVERRPNRHHEIAVSTLRAVHGLLY